MELSLYGLSYVPSAVGTLKVGGNPVFVCRRRQSTVCFPENHRLGAHGALPPDDCQEEALWMWL